MLRLKPSTLLLALAFAASTSQAAVVTFEGHADDGGVNQTSEGYRFDFAALGWGIFTDSFIGGGAPWTSNGTTRLVAQGDTASVTMSAIDGSSFDLNSVDAATMFPGFASRLEVTGQFSGGGSISTVISVDDSFDPYAFGGFVGLRSVVFRDLAPGAYRQTGGLSLDNIVINESRVPEPATWLLTLGALGALGSLRGRGAARRGRGLGR